MSVPRNIYFVSIHPHFINAYANFGVFKSATAQGLVAIHALDLRQFAVDHRGSVDERPYGGGDGMVMRPEPLVAALATIPKPYKVVHLTPQAKVWTHDEALTLSLHTSDLVFICGRFAGIDQRFLDRYVDLQFSVGHFVVSGGELPALLIVDSVLRQIPGVLGDPRSAEMDSFAAGLGGGIEGPLYTKPPEFEGVSVPAVLLSGDHEKIAQWRNEQSRLATARFKR